jgi:putative RNA 2'-phosphotransferase
LGHSRKSPKLLDRFLSYVTGRRPDEFGLVPDDDGWLKIKDVLKVMAEEEGWKHVRRRDLDEVLLSIREPSIELMENLVRSRSQELVPRPFDAPRPPNVLYTCIRRRAYPRVHQIGLKPGALPYVVLSSEKEMALRMGRRYDPDPVLLTVHTGKTMEKGGRFAQFGEALYLSGELSPRCFSGPPLPREKEKAPKKSAENDSAKKKQMAGSFLLQAEATEPGRSKRDRKGGKKEIAWKKERRRMKRKKR